MKFSLEESSFGESTTRIRSALGRCIHMPAGVLQEFSPLRRRLGKVGPKAADRRKKQKRAFASIGRTDAVESSKPALLLEIRTAEMDGRSGCTHVNHK